MIIIKASSINEAVRSCFHKLYQEKIRPFDQDLYRESPLLLQICWQKTHVLHVSILNNQFQFDKNYKIISDSDRTINKVISHYQTKLLDSNKLNLLIRAMKNKPSSRRLVLDIWQNENDINSMDEVPCVIYFWFRIVSNALEMHTHMRANDGFKKFWLNLEIFSAIHDHVARTIDKQVGQYLHIVDSFHFYSKNKKEIGTLIKIL
ncbi:hypothetical protein A2313_00920 [Candidatus Roizmanbacteria bacterium RIFOXYB2_FULL_41_10]|uniref:Thymidylate synthase/dCMP hydroxymethylase domain-containing protein n=1 Tax=Candidatus Roizmanbacteria bacterium RIFOXYA1_FULL_41_12 TaxID=1802082 RepID=A0A1F7KFC0_9BACT|nr:MAG: hypothetical protein A2262_03735 [Candidatus Roizmanbacteria bacterium RIFOXYA2_FULL_41_8]OGK66555.1 MAG: hypothetical protein A2209_00975 [Candidatus Roizmanbacteria bacterium RIFOXYA1_FULL_41_12]OGK67255.1 MAG: hypothetical protein A2377_01415 [Candidatus Roizmanbacteria bacterium RIFOXYB1_FULL_41_27]OGK69327.1 MAG: hypothetical protein A2313_00920 [Candidatus Roizmanbacteria bacterium RIFOXYB2_FULL_41_10]OGK71785.1 MAG: hypothetical protein A2403_00285 [Candidatus Roizmanbacteria bac